MANNTVLAVVACTCRTLWDRSISFLLYWAILATVVAWFFCSSLMSPEMICEEKEKLVERLPVLHEVAVVLDSAVVGP